MHFTLTRVSLNHLDYFVSEFRFENVVKLQTASEKVSCFELILSVATIAEAEALGCLSAECTFSEKFCVRLKQRVGEKEGRGRAHSGQYRHLESSNKDSQ